MSSLDRILPFLKPIEDLLVDPAVTEVMVNGGGRRVFVERYGGLEQVERPPHRPRLDQATVRQGPADLAGTRRLASDANRELGG